MSLAFASFSFSLPFRHKRLPRQACSPRVVPSARIAIIGTVPSTFTNAILSSDISPSDVSLSKAIEQHAIYSHILATTPSITALYQSPSDPDFPDGVFVEDPLVIISPRTAFMPTAGHESRAGEGAALGEILKRVGVSVKRVPEVRLDGGDVLKIAGFVLVGLSERTESASVAALQSAIDEEVKDKKQAPKVVPVSVVGGLHLKSLVTWVGSVHAGAEGFLVAPEGENGAEIVQRIRETTGKEWDVAWVPENESLAANVLYVPPEQDVNGETAKGAVLVQKSCPASVQVVRDKVAAVGLDTVEVVAVDMSELAKANGALTCMSVIV